MKEWFSLKKMLKDISDLYHTLLFHRVDLCTLLSVSCQVSDKLGTCIVVGLTGHLLKMFTFTLEYTNFFLNKCPI
jgi:hypothetical protein